jgi:hypothetical protein
MRKTTQYKVSGVLETKPENLPEGLEVSEVEVDLPNRQFKVNPIHNFGGVTITEYPFERGSSFGGVGLQLPNVGILSESEVRNLRDFLNVVLNENNFNGRVLVDSVEDVWFEFYPDVWTQGNDVGDTNPNPWERANQRHGSTDDAPGLTRQSLSEIERRYGPVRFIDNRWR